MSNSVIKYQLEKTGILWLKFNHEKKENPFSREMTQNLIQLAPVIEKDPQIKAIILTGGKDRSFSVGGDFQDVSALKYEDEIAEYLLEIIDLYKALLSINKPLIAGIDNFAIGQGLQVSLMCDWKIGTNRSIYSMPELKNGVACPLGSCILEHLFGRSLMLEWVIGCAQIDALAALEKSLINQMTTPDHLEASLKEKAVELSKFPQVPYQLTKRIQNKRFIQLLDQIREDAAFAHVQSFLKKSGEKHFQQILKKKDESITREQTI